MRVKQIGLRCFEFEAKRGGADALKEYLQTHAAILSPYLILMVGERDEASDRVLKNSGLIYAWAASEHTLLSKTLGSQAAPQPAQNDQTAIAQKPSATIVKKPVRSGETVLAEGDALFFARINSGAEILARGNCFLFAPLFGQCVAEGETAIVSAVGKGGLFIFHGEVYESAYFDAPKRFFWNNGKIEAENHL